MEQHILRLLNTNVDGKRKVMYALTEIKGVGRRYSNIVCKKADVDLNKRCVDTLNSCQSSPPYCACQSGRPQLGRARTTGNDHPKSGTIQDPFMVSESS